MAVSALMMEEDTSLEGYVARFERRERRRDLSPASLRTYRWALSQFVEWCADHGLVEPAQLTRTHLEAYQDQLIDRNLTAKSRSVQATALRQFLLFLVWAEAPIDARLPMFIDPPRTPRRQPKPIPPADLAKLRDHLLQLPPRDDLVGRRDRALFFTLLLTSARVSEVLQLPRQGWERFSVRQKGGSPKELVIGPPVDAMIRDYLAVRTDSLPNLWVTHDTRRPTAPLQAATVREGWQRITRRLGIPYFTTHRIRHTAATLLGEAGYDRGAAADYLGHHGLASIQGYTAYGEGQKEQARRILGGFIGEAPEERPAVLVPLRPRARRRRRLESPGDAAG